MSSNFYLIRPYPNDDLRIEEFRQKNVIAIGWGDIGNVLGKSRDEIRELLKHSLREHPERLRNALSTFLIFLGLKEGDYILAPESGMGPIHVARVVGGYRYDPSCRAGDWAHQCGVQWGATYKRDDVADSKLSSALKFPGTAANLRSHKTAIRIMLGLHDASAEPADTFVTAEYPLRPGALCKVSFPRDMTQDEARRLSIFVGTLYFG